MPFQMTKMEKSREHKRADRDEKQESQKRKRNAAQEKEDADALALSARQTSKRCCTCDRSFMQEHNRDTHQKVCVGKTTKLSREANANSKNVFASLRGAAVDITDSTVIPVPQDDGYGPWVKDWTWGTLDLTDLRVG